MKKKLLISCKPGYHNFHQVIKQHKFGYFSNGDDGSIDVYDEHKIYCSKCGVVKRI